MSKKSAMGGAGAVRWWVSVSLLLTLSLTQASSWESGSDLLGSRVFHGTCAAAGMLIAFGGQNTGGGPGLGSVEAYDPATDTWSPRQDMPNPRLGMMVAAVDDVCYVIGGSPAPGAAAVDFTERYDPVADTWTALSPLPTARAVGAAAAVDGRIYVAGGAAQGNTTSPVFSTLEIYDPSSNTWSTGPDMPSARASLAGAALGNQVHFLGGGASGVLASESTAHEVFDTQSNTWSSAPNLPTARGELAAAVLGGNLLAIGGARGQSTVPFVEHYDPVLQTWTDAPSLPSARWGLRAAVLNNRVFVTGGSSEFGFGHNSLARNEIFGAEVFAINPGINDAWFNPATAGQGFFIIVYPDIPLMFLAWFTYDTELPDASLLANVGAPGQRWLTAQGPYAGNEGTLDILTSSGGVFDTGDPAPDSEVSGEMTVTFDSCLAGTVSYSIPQLSLSGQIPIQRVAEDNVTLCEELSSE
ncbi:MAG: kelch repeat-containing protein [Pseudomonadota bacterium]